MEGGGREGGREGVTGKEYIECERTKIVFSNKY